ncbi:MAG: type II toxin-antitoxin system HicB family antitoxin [Dehalococcoidia bacterium]
MRFQVVFTYDSEYKGYVADVPELPGCMSQGKNLDEAIENIRDAIRGYLYVEEKHGRVPIS